MEQFRLYFSEAGLEFCDEFALVQFKPIELLQIQILPAYWSLRLNSSVLQKELNYEHLCTMNEWQQIEKPLAKHVYN